MGHRKSECNTFIENVKGGYRVYCEVCKAEDIIRPPMPLEAFIAWVKSFGRAHKHCKKGSKVKHGKH